MSELTLQQRLANAVDQVWAEHFGGPQGSLWTVLDNKQLYAIEAFFWGHHQDIVLEWTRRQMRAADPSPRP